MELGIKKAFQDLLFWILKLIDGICRVFSMLVGQGEISYNKDENTQTSSSLMDFFLEQPLFIDIFGALFVVSVIVLVLCMAFAAFRTMFSNKAEGETKSHTKIIGDGLRSLITTCLIFVIALVGIRASNTLLNTVTTAINGDNPTSLTQVILELGVTDRKSTVHEQASQLIKDYQLTNDKVNWVFPPEIDVKFLPDDMNTPGEVEKILEKNGDIWDEEKGTWNWLYVTSGGVTPEDQITRETRIKDLFEDGYLKDNVTANDIWGTYTKNWIGLPNGAWDGDEAAIDGSGYEEIKPFIAAIIFLLVLCTTCFTLVKRAFDIVVLLFVLPFVNATVPLDDGAHMKLWRETMISKILLAFGAVVAIAVFNLLAPMISEIVVTYKNGATNSVLTAVIQMLVLIGGGLSISGGMALISRLVGTGIAEGNEMAASARMLLTGGTVALGAGLAAWRVGNDVLRGKKNMLGQRSGGLLKAGGTLLGAGAKVLGGNAYTGMKRKAGEKISGAISKTKGKIMENNGLIGGLAKVARKGAAGETAMYRKK